MSLHADGADLPRASDPASTHTPGKSASRPASGRPRSAERVDDELLDRAHVGGGVGEPAAALPGQRQDRVADQLAGPVVGDVAAPVGPHQLGADRRPAARSRWPRSAADPERVHVRVLEQQQVVVAATRVNSPRCSAWASR